jgi:hypothetical protein
MMVRLHVLTVSLRHQLQQTHNQGVVTGEVAKADAEGVAEERTDTNRGEITTANRTTLKTKSLLLILISRRAIKSLIKPPLQDNIPCWSVQSPIQPVAHSVLLMHRKW